MNEYMTKRVLIVDDAMVNCLVLTKVLKKLGKFQISTASNGLEAWNMLKDSASKGFFYDYVLTDMWMPGMTGSELCDNVRSEEMFDKTSVFAVTSDSDIYDRHAEIGFNGCCMKPFGVQSVRDMMACG